MNPLLSKSVITRFIAIALGFAVTLTLHASEVDTFYLPQYKICNPHLKRCLKIAKDGGGYYCRSSKCDMPHNMVVANFKQGNEEYLMVGYAHTFEFSYYSGCIEIRSNNLIGCTYFKGNLCLFYGDLAKQYLSDSIGRAIIIDRRGVYRPLVGNEADYREWLDTVYASGLIVDPPAWFFKRIKKKFVLIDNFRWKGVGEAFWDGNCDANEIAEKLHSTYAYCANNQIKLIEPNSED